MVRLSGLVVACLFVQNAWAGSFYAPEPVQTPPVIDIPASQEALLLSEGMGVDNLVSYRSSLSPDGRWAWFKAEVIDSTQVYDLDNPPVTQEVEYRVDLHSGERMALYYEPLASGERINGIPRIYNDGSLVAYTRGDPQGFFNIIKVEPDSSTVSYINEMEDGVRFKLPSILQSDRPSGIRDYVFTNADASEVLVPSNIVIPSDQDGLLDLFIISASGAFERIPVGIEIMQSDEFSYTASADLTQFLIFHNAQGSASPSFLLINRDGVATSLQGIVDDMLAQGASSAPFSMLLSNDGASIGISFIRQGAGGQDIVSILYDVATQLPSRVLTNAQFPALGNQLTAEFSA